MSRCGIMDRGAALRSVFAILFASAGLIVGTAAAQDGEGAPGEPLGDGTEMIYENCYEQVAGFRVPLSLIRGLVGSELPPSWRTGPSTRREPSAS
jgi:hypothetical protein